jgi:hypothetical protein
VISKYFIKSILSITFCTSTANFTLWRATSKQLAPGNPDEARCEKLCQVNTAFSLKVDYELRKIQVPQTQSEIIRKIMQCLIQKESLN